MEYGLILDVNVSDILDTVGNLSVGLDSITDDDKQIYLKYLNLVHFELYRLTASVNTMATITQSEMESADGEVTEAFNPFLIRSVYIPVSANQNYTLSPITYSKLLGLNPSGGTKTTRPTNWYLKNNKLYTYAKYTGNLQVIYINQPEEFTENTLSKEIPYPVSYHQVLVDGTIYYVLQDESGLKNSEELTLATQRWNKGKKEIYNYLTSLAGGEIISTYSEI